MQRLGTGGVWIQKGIYQAHALSTAWLLKLQAGGRSGGIWVGFDMRVEVGRMQLCGDWAVEKSTKISIDAKIK